MSMYVITHKPYKFPDDNCYKPIQVGGTFDNNLLSDSSLENISEKNANYCELTALYWIWKNRNDEYIGLSHYRRYFIDSTSKLKFNELPILDVTKDFVELEGNVIIAPSKVNIGHSVYNHWNKYHKLEDWFNVLDVIRELYPDYIDSYFNVSQSKSIHLYNMFYARKELMNSYCEWLFDILFEMESKVDIDNYDSYQARLFGFLSERLFNVWLDCNNVKVIELDVQFIGVSEVDSRKSTMINKIENLLRDKMNDFIGNSKYFLFKFLFSSSR